jgi:hypothetical protein
VTPDDLERDFQIYVTSQDKTRPGLLMRVDRLELLAKLIIVGGGIGLLYKIVDVFGALIALKAASSP